MYALLLYLLNYTASLGISPVDAVTVAPVATAAGDQGVTDGGGGLFRFMA